MKPFRSLSLVLLLMILPLMSFAANHKTINVPEPVKVGTTVLQPGDYVVQWEGSGSSVQVTFKQNNKTVVTAPATVQTQATGYNGALDLKSVQGSDTKLLHAIELKNIALVFDQGTSAGGQ
jgi:hypothetical protein